MQRWFYLVMAEFFVFNDAVVVSSAIGLLAFVGWRNLLVLRVCTKGCEGLDAHESGKDQRTRPRNQAQGCVHAATWRQDRSLPYFGAAVLMSSKWAAGSVPAELP